MGRGAGLAGDHPGPSPRVHQGPRQGPRLVDRHGVEPKVEALTADPPPPAQRHSPDPELVRRVAAHRAAWEAVWVARYPDPRRHTLRRVLDVLLDRMTRTANPRVPCPQRDLVLDTGLSRPTVTAALTVLHDDGWIVLERSFTPRSDRPEDRSHHAVLPERPPTGSPMGRGLSDSLPPSSSTPQPPYTPTALRLAAHLGPRVWHLYLALRSRPDPTSPADVAYCAGWTDRPSPGLLSARTDRTVAAGLDRLAAAGLVECDAHGRWSASGPRAGLRPHPFGGRGRPPAASGRDRHRAGRVRPGPRRQGHMGPAT